MDGIDRREYVGFFYNCPNRVMQYILSSADQLKDFHYMGTMGKFGMQWIYEE